VKFEIGSTIVILDSPAQYPLQPSYSKVQAKDKSASGITHVESFQVQTNNHIFTFADMSQDDYQRLLNFFLNDADGMLNEFYLTDDLDEVRFVRFDSPKISFSQNSIGLWNGSFSVEEVI